MSTAPRPREEHATGATPARAAAPMTPTTVAWLAALLGWTTLLSFYHLDGGARFEQIDCWVAQTAREMLEAHDWIVPRFAGEMRLQKSPGPYWAVMLTSVLRGGPVDEVSARIPNALAAIILVATIFWLTRQIAGDRAAVFAGFAASSSVLVLWWSHRAAIDLGLTTCTTLSLAAIWIASEALPPGPRRNALWLLGYVAAGVGMLYKMPVPLVAVGLPAFSYVLLRWRWSILANRWHLVGMVLFLATWVWWVLAVGRAVESAWWKWKVEFLDRFTGDMPNYEDQRGWWFYFLYVVPPLLYCLPFSLSLPQALWRGVRPPAGVKRNGAGFLVIWFISLLAFFSVASGKEERYFLPALPPLFCLLGIELAALFDPNRSPTPRRDRVAALAAWTVLPAGLLSGTVFGMRNWWQLRGRFELDGLCTWSDVLIAGLITAAILAAGFAAAAALYVRRREHASFGVLVATMWVMWLWVWPNVMPLMMSQRPYTDFAAQLRSRVPAELRPALANVGTHDSRVIWFSDLRFPRAVDQLDLLREQSGKRNKRYEERRIGEEIVRSLEADRPVLFVAAFKDYLRFRLAAPEALAEAGRPTPPLHLWLQSRYGREDRHCVLFGNRPPPFPEPTLWISDALRAELSKTSTTLSYLGASAPTHSQPASAP